MNNTITDKLGAKLQKTNDIHKFLQDNHNELLNIDLPKYLKLLLKQKNLKKAQVIKQSGLPNNYTYKIFSGEKKTSRERILALALAMNLSLTETNHLLIHAHYNQLYVRNSWDAIIIYAIKNKLNVINTNLLLNEFNESPLLE